MNIDEIFETQDMPLAATLLYYKFPLLELNRENPKRVGFVFEMTSEFGEIAQQVSGLYWQKMLTVEPYMYYSNLRFLKQRIINNEESNGTDRRVNPEERKERILGDSRDNNELPVQPQKSSSKGSDDATGTTGKNRKRNSV